MKVIGAGLPRTATTTQMIALEMLGLPCYHMRDMMSDVETSVPQFRKAFEGDADWDEIFQGKPPRQLLGSTNAPAASRGSGGSVSAQPSSGRLTGSRVWVRPRTAR